MKTDERISCTVTVIDSNVKPSRRSHVKINIGDYIEHDPYNHIYINPIWESQASPIGGIYTLSKIDLCDIDVIFKDIANREHFNSYDHGGYQTDILNGIKNNFYHTPPVTLELCEGKYYSVDGHHRITIAKELGLTNILAFVTEVEKPTYER